MESWRRLYDLYLRKTSFVDEASQPCSPLISYSSDGQTVSSFDAADDDFPPSHHFLPYVSRPVTMANKAEELKEQGNVSATPFH